MHKYNSVAKMSSGKELQPKSDMDQLADQEDVGESVGQSHSGLVRPAGERERVASKTQYSASSHPNSRNTNLFGQSRTYNIVSMKQLKQTMTKNNVEFLFKPILQQHASEAHLQERREHIAREGENQSEYDQRANDYGQSMAASGKQNNLISRSQSRNGNAYEIGSKQPKKDGDAAGRIGSYANSRSSQSMQRSGKGVYLNLNMMKQRQQGAKDRMQSGPSSASQSPIPNPQHLVREKLGGAATVDMARQPAADVEKNAREQYRDDLAVTGSNFQGGSDNLQNNRQIIMPQPRTHHDVGNVQGINLNEPSMFDRHSIPVRDQKLVALTGGSTWYGGPRKGRKLLAPAGRGNAATNWSKQGAVLSDTRYSHQIPAPSLQTFVRHSSSEPYQLDSVTNTANLSSKAMNSKVPSFLASKRDLNIRLVGDSKPTTADRTAHVRATDQLRNMKAQEKQKIEEGQDAQNAKDTQDAALNESPVIDDDRIDGRRFQRQSRDGPTNIMLPQVLGNNSDERSPSKYSSEAKRLYTHGEAQQPKYEEDQFDAINPSAKVITSSIVADESARGEKRVYIQQLLPEAQKLGDSEKAVAGMAKESGSINSTLLDQQPKMNESTANNSSTLQAESPKNLLQTSQFQRHMLQNQTPVILERVGERSIYLGSTGNLKTHETSTRNQQLKEVLALPLHQTQLRNHSYHYHSLRQLEDLKNNPFGRVYPQEKLLQLIRKHKDEIGIVRRTIERQAKDIERYKNQQKRLIEENYQLKYRNGMLQSPDASNPVLAMTSQSTGLQQDFFGITQIDQSSQQPQTHYASAAALKTPNQYQDLLIQVDELKKENSQQRSTIKRYRQLISKPNESNQDRDRQLANESRQSGSRPGRLRQTQHVISSAHDERWFDAESAPTRDNQGGPQKPQNQASGLGSNMYTDPAQPSGLVNIERYLNISEEPRQPDVAGEQPGVTLAKRRLSVRSQADAPGALGQDDAGDANEDSLHIIENAASRQNGSGEADEDASPQRQDTSYLRTNLDHSRHSRLDERQSSVGGRLLGEDSQAAKSPQAAYGGRTGGKSLRTRVPQQNSLAQMNKEIVKVYNHQRMEKLHRLISSIQAAKSMPDVAIAMLKHIKDVVNCAVGSFFVFDKDLFCDADRAHITIQKTIVESRYIDVVALSDLDVQNPAFYTVNGAAQLIYTLKFMSHPIFDSDGKLLGTIQVESKYRLRKLGAAGPPGEKMKSSTASQKDSKIENGVVKKKEYLGFSMIDEQVMSLISSTARIKMDQLVSLRRKTEMEQEVVNTIELAGAICTQRSQTDLVAAVKSSLPKFFGFEGAGILLRDVKTEQLLSVNELSKEEAEPYLRDKFQQQRKKDTAMKQRYSLAGADQVPKTGRHSGGEDVAAREAEEQRYVDEFIHEFRETKKITFPNNRGITGVAFHENKTVHTNKIHADRVFSADVDNQTPVKDVRNFIIGPVYAHAEPLKEEVAPLQFDRQKPIGVIQLINKNNFEGITEHDLNKFRAMQPLIGLSIDQASEIHSFINIRVGVQENIQNIERMLAYQIAMDKEYDEVGAREHLGINDAKREIRQMLRDLDNRYPILR